jgi:S-adenosylmethionine synthetase
MSAGTAPDVQFSARPDVLPFETVEKKGVGHPDTLADAVAEETSDVIARYFLDTYGAIPRYNADMVAIVGGDVACELGKGEIRKKATIDVAGNVHCFDGKDVDAIRSTAESRVYAYLTGVLRFDARALFDVRWTLNRYSARNASFFRGGTGGKEMPLAEDTVVAYGFSPCTALERTTLETDRCLRSLSGEFPVGSDTKILAIRDGVRQATELCVSVGFRATELRDYDEYAAVKGAVQRRLDGDVRNMLPDGADFSLAINTGDDPSRKKGYYLLSGSAAEHDKGIAGKGNRLPGFMAPFRYHSYEAVFGKNPVYHTGKLYNVIAFFLAKSISDRIHDAVETVLVSQVGQPLSHPKAIAVISRSVLSEVQKKNSAEVIGQKLEYFFSPSDAHPTLPNISEDIVRRGNLTRFEI